MRHIIKAIPNTITSCNLLSGCFAIYFAILGHIESAFWFVVAAAVFDFLDGFAARMLKAFSPIGADLDSLADVVSFGVAPAFTMFVILGGGSASSIGSLPWYSLIGFLLAVFGALRLAKFNVDTRQTEEFRGLPIPGMALFIMSYAMSYDRLLPTGTVPMITTTLILIVVFSLLMVSDIPMFSFKFKSFAFSKNKVRYIFALLALATVCTMGYAAPAIIILGYVATSLILSRSTN